MLKVRFLFSTPYSKSFSGVIEEVLAEATLDSHPSEERKGLALFVSKDGNAVLGQATLNSSSDTYERTLGDSTLSSV